MRGRLLFAFLFTLTLWSCAHLLGQAQARRDAQPPLTRVSAQITLLPAPQMPKGPQSARQTPRKALAAPQGASASCRPAPAPMLTMPYYRSAWQAFRLEGSAG